jgi:uncharacterized protein
VVRARGLRERVLPYLRELGDEPTAAIAGACAVLIVGHYQGSTSFFRRTFGTEVAAHPAAAALPYLWWFGCSVLLFLLIPLTLSALTRGSFTRRYGLGLGDWRAGLIISALFLLVMLPATYIASRSPTFATHYPLAGQGAFTLRYPGPREVISLRLFALYEAGYILYFVGWEFLFRGWLTNAVLPRFGRAGAVLIPTAPFAIMHLGKPELEALGSIAAGIALGILALRTRSIWYGVLVHAAVAVFMDLLAAWPYLARR